MSDKSKIEWTDATWNPIIAVDRATGKRGWVVFGGQSALSVSGGEILLDLADNVCSAPDCVEKAYREAASKVRQEEP